MAGFFSTPPPSGVNGLPSVHFRLPCRLGCVVMVACVGIRLGGSSGICKWRDHQRNRRGTPQTKKKVSRILYWSNVYYLQFFLNYWNELSFVSFTFFTFSLLERCRGIVKCELSLKSAFLIYQKCKDWKKERSFPCCALEKVSVFYLDQEWW